MDRPGPKFGVDQGTVPRVVVLSRKDLGLSQVSIKERIGDGNRDCTKMMEARRNGTSECSVSRNENDCTRQYVTKK